MIPSIHIEPHQRKAAPRELEDTLGIIRKLNQRIKDLEAENLFYRAENEALNKRALEFGSMAEQSESDRQFARIVSEFGITHQQCCLLVLLLKRPVLTVESAMQSLYGMRDDPPEDHIIRVFITRIRARLKPRGVTIQTKWGVGYYISPEHKEIIRSMTE